MVANRQNQRVYAALDAVLPHLDPIEDKRREWWIWWKQLDAMDLNGRILTVLIRVQAVWWLRKTGGELQHVALGRRWIDPKSHKRAETWSTIDWHGHLIEHLRFDLSATLDYTGLSLPKSPRWCIYRPAGQDESWRTAENLHLDVNPWTYAGLKPTEIETLRQRLAESGGFKYFFF